MKPIYRKFLDLSKLNFRSVQEILKVIHINTLIEQMQATMKKLEKDKKRILAYLESKCDGREKSLHK